MIRVLVAAGSPVVRAGLDALVRSAVPELEVVGNVPDDAAMVADAVERLDPDVVLLESERRVGPGAARLLAALAPADAPRASPATVLLVESGDAELAADALRTGVRAVLSRGAAGAEIVAAVKAVAAGLTVLPPELVENLLVAPIRPSSSSEPGVSSAGATSSDGDATPLTPRETEVLSMLAEGLANKQIAPRLGISEHTVKYHVTSIFAKLGASSRTEAVTIGARRGLVML